ncbi:MAG: chemotaxis response regulator protein-glutamate methylesterase [Nostocaceae cyanobacterium]|nr:chemotaxis response regulator protein-glutamate methylesterase [Nostocaceae cyanobacterium]
MRIAIVNDMITAVETLRRVLMTVPEYQVAWIARDGVEAVNKCAQDTPDLILMDLVIPVMDGVEATRQIMQSSPCAILVVTASVGENASKVFAAMGYGALDAVNTPVLGVSGNPESAQALLNKIVTISKLIGKSTRTSKSKASADNSQSPLPTICSRLVPLVVIGSSTGGPNALAAILSQLPANFNAAIVVVQHVDAQFAGGMVEWLNPQTPLTVQLATEGSHLEVGKVLIAGTNDHLSLQPNLRLSYIKDPIDYPYRPSVDVLFKSVAQHWRRQGIAVLLTGMGRDGAAGMNLLRAKGWHTIAQNQATCVVYGMPKAAVELNAAVEVLPLDAIAPTLMAQLPVNC